MATQDDDSHSLSHREPSVVDTHDYELIRDRDNEIDDAKFVDDPKKHVPRIGAIDPWTAMREAVPLPHIYVLNANPFKPGNILVAGSFATLVFMALWYPLYFYYRTTSLDLFALFGSFVYPKVDLVCHVIGFVLMFGFGVSLAATYALLLLFLRTQSKGVKGAFFGFGLHVAMMAFGLPLAVAFNSFGAAGQAGYRFDEIDMLLQHIGHGNEDWFPTTLALCAHLTFGILVGAFYRHNVVRQEEDLL